MHEPRARPYRCPAPDVRWVELDPQWLGTPFLVMRRIDGEARPTSRLRVRRLGSQRRA